jgi:hypothetical protein
MHRGGREPDGFSSFHFSSMALVLTSCASLSSRLQGMFGWAKTMSAAHPLDVAQVVREVLQDRRGKMTIFDTHLTLNAPRKTPAT